MLVIFAALLVSSFPLVGAVYAQRTSKPTMLIALYVVFCALSQIMAAKIAVFDFGFTTFTAPAAVLVFAVTFLITDVVNEKFGRHEVHRMIFVTFFTQVALVAFLWIGGLLPPAPFWEGETAWNSLLGVVPRITFASWATFLVSENLDAYLFSMLRQRTQGRYLWLRNAVSSIASLTVDTVLFVTLAFAGTDLPIWSLMVGQFVIKYFVALLDIPFMYLNRAFLGPRLVADHQE